MEKILKNEELIFKDGAKGVYNISWDGRLTFKAKLVKEARGFNKGTVDLVPFKIEYRLREFTVIKSGIEGLFTVIKSGLEGLDVVRVFREKTGLDLHFKYYKIKTGRKNDCVRMNFYEYPCLSVHVGRKLTPFELTRHPGYIGKGRNK